MTAVSQSVRTEKEVLIIVKEPKLLLKNGAELAEGSQADADYEKALINKLIEIVEQRDKLVEAMDGDHKRIQNLGELSQSESNRSEANHRETTVYVLRRESSNSRREHSNLTVWWFAAISSILAGSDDVSCESLGSVSIRSSKSLAALNGSVAQLKGIPGKKKKRKGVKHYIKKRYKRVFK